MERLYSCLTETRAYLRAVEIRTLELLRQPHRYGFEPVIPFYAERVALTVERAAHFVQCRLGDHVVKFETWPECIYCHRKVRV